MINLRTLQCLTIICWDDLYQKFSVLIATHKCRVYIYLGSMLFNIQPFNSHWTILQHYTHTVQCNYNTFQYNMILHTALQWPRYNVNQSFRSQHTYHSSPLGARYMPACLLRGFGKMTILWITTWLGDILPRGLFLLGDSCEGKNPVKQLILSTISSSSISSSSLKMLIPPFWVGFCPVAIAAVKGVMLYVYFSRSSLNCGKGNGCKEYTS